MKYATFTSRFLNLYVIRRDHGRRVGFFLIDLKHGDGVHKDRGLGFQLPIGPYVVGLSLGHFPRDFWQSTFDTKTEVVQ